MAEIVVVGVTGNVGSRVARKLSARGKTVRGVARDPGGFPGEGVELVAADVTQGAEARRALDGAAGVYLTLPEMGDDPLRLETAVGTTVIEAARDVGIGHVVLHTTLHGDRGDTGARILDNKWPIEQALTASGLPFTILRPAWFLQNLFAAKGYLEQGFFSMPWPGDRPWAATSVEDVAEAAVAFFERGPANEGFDLHIKGGVTGAQICEEAGKVLGRQVQYQQFPGASREFVEPFPISAAHKDLYAELFDYFQATEYLGDPTAISQALPALRMTSVHDFLTSELFPEAAA